MAGKMRCAGCGEAVGAAAMQTWDSMNGLAYCGKPECQKAWAASLPRAVDHGR